MRKTKIALMVLALLALVAMPASANEDKIGETSDPPCVKVEVDPPGYYVDPPCIIRTVEDLIETVEGLIEFS